METTINRGGISELSIIRMSNASELLMLDKNTVYKPTPETGYLWENIEFTEIKKFEHPATVGNSGRIVAFSANIIHAGYDEIKEDTLNVYRDRPLYLFYRTLNNQLHIVENVWMSFSRIIDPATNTVTGYDILFKTELPHDIYYCSTDQIVVVEPTEKTLWLEPFTAFDTDGRKPVGWDWGSCQNTSITTNGSNLNASSTLSESKYSSDYMICKYFYDTSKFSNKKLRIEFNINEINLPQQKLYEMQQAGSHLILQVRKLLPNNTLMYAVNQNYTTLDSGILSFNFTTEDLLRFDVIVSLSSLYVIGNLLLEFTSIKIIEVP